MNWDAIGAVGDLVSGIAVLATLVYLAVQIKQAKNLMLSNTHQVRTDRNIALSQYLANDEQHLRRSTGQWHVGDAEPAEVLRATLVFSTVLRHFEDMQYQFELGVVDDNTWNANCGGLQKILISEGASDLWAQCKHMFREQFVVLVDGMLDGSA